MKKDANKVKLHVVSLLEEAGYTQVAKRRNLIVGQRMYCTGFVGKQSSNITFSFSDKRDVPEVVKLLSERSIKTTVSPDKPDAFRVPIQNVYDSLSRKQSVGVSATNEEAVVTALTKSPEQQIIEKLLDGKNIHYTGAVDENDPAILYVKFDSDDHAERAKDILDNNRVNYVDEEREMFISLALPDALLSGLINDESSLEKAQRRISEYSNLLVFALTKRLNLKIHPALGKKALLYGHVIVSGDNGKRRIDFADPETKAQTEAILSQAGFYCIPSQTNGKTTLIVDLEQSEQKALVQDAGPEMLTIKEVKRRIAATSNLKPTTIGYPMRDGVKFLVFYFETAQQAAFAAGMFKPNIMGIGASDRGMFFPSTSVKGYRQNPNKANHVSAEKKAGKTATSQPKPQPTSPKAEKNVATKIEDAIALLKEALLEEHAGYIESLKNQHYLIPKDVSEEIIIPHEKMSSGIVVIDGRGVVINTKLLFEFIQK